MTLVNIVQAVKQVLSVKNAGVAGQYGFVLSDSRRNLYEAVEAVLEADDEIVLAIKETFDHWARPDLLADSVEIPHGSRIPQHQGEIGKVLIQRSSSAAFLPARGRRQASEIERLRANTGTYPNDVYGKSVHTQAGSPLSGFYDLSEEQLLFYTGYSAKVEIANTSRLSRTTTDAGINATAKLLSSSAAVFASADIGSIALIGGAGVGGVDFASEIRAVAAPNATLADAASTTVSNATLLIARCQSPADYQSAVVGKAIAKMFKEGDDATLWTFHLRQAEAFDAMVRRNQRLLPDVVAMEKAA
jgi:hypothetical protein